MTTRARDALLLAPSGLLYLLLLVVPLLLLARTSLLPPGPAAPLEGPLSVGSYAALADGYYVTILIRTLRIAALTTLFTLALGYPLAIAVSRSHGGWRTLQLLLIVSPLFVSVVVRSYGWILLLGNRGLINTLLMSAGVIDAPLRLIHREGAVVVALVEALLPFMALSIIAVLDRLAPDLEDAARGLGASPFRGFVHVTLPLSLPGALSGAVLVFMVSLGSYATPALVGGARIRVMVTEIYTQATSVFNWPLAASLSLSLLVIALVLATLSRKLAR
jgi:putative spermidine/putrescine transport system permease protein